jgi:hypothetical protein
MENGIRFAFVGSIPKKTLEKDSKYDAVIKALMENPDTPIEIKKRQGNGLKVSASGLRNAIKREFGENAWQVVVVERKKRAIYVVYDTKGTYIKRKPN